MVWTFHLRPRVLSRDAPDGAKTPESSYAGRGVQSYSAYLVYSAYLASHILSTPSIVSILSVLSVLGRIRCTECTPYTQCTALRAQVTDFLVLKKHHNHGSVLHHCLARHRSAWDQFLQKELEPL